MDSLTHIALGACIGEAFFEKGFGKKAMWWGALAQSIPDIDFLSAIWMNTPESLLAHRGFTHGILFAMAMIPFFSFAASYFHRPHNIAMSKWVLFFSAELLAHLFLDVFNNYGIGWLEPFSHQRFSFNTLYVVDVFFSIIPFFAFFKLIQLNQFSLKRKLYWKLGLLVPIIYLTLSISIKLYMSSEIKHYLTSKRIHYSKLMITPAPLQSFLWYIIVKDKNGFYVGYKSIFDTKHEISFSYYLQHNDLIKNIDDHENLQQLIRFSQGIYIIQHQKDQLIFNDLRFGQIDGWSTNKHSFIFHYVLIHPNDQKLLIQQGRLSQLNAHSMYSLLMRVKGN